MKKFTFIAITITIILAALGLSSCGIRNKVENAVDYPDSYSITYEITTKEGLIHSLTKTVDENGNIYFKNKNEEKLFINNNGSYSLYEKNSAGVFEKVDGVKYTLEAVECEISLFDSYAKQTTNKFIPTARRASGTTVAERTADVYKIGVNLLAVTFHHFYTVDTETGICLGVSVNNTVFGKETKSNEETFICTEFITNNIEDLSNKIIK